MNNKNIFNTRYPIIQAPMAGNILDAEFIIKICNSGMLGFIPSGYLSLAQLEDFIIKVKQNIDHDSIFGVNIFIEKPRISQTIYKPNYLYELEKNFDEITSLTVNIPKNIEESDYIELLIKYSVKIVSCTFGFFNHSSIKKLKEHNIKIIANITNIEEFNFCIENGADAIVIQGTEAGGHQASFLNSQANKTTTRDLLNQINQIAHNSVIIVAGGVSTNNYKNYLYNNANYVQLGTAFMLTKESKLPQKIKEFIIKSQNTSLSNKITGQYARGIQNTLMQSLETHNINPEFPIQHYLTSEIRKMSRNENNPQFMSLWVGSNSDNFKLRLLDDLIQELIDNY